MVKKHKVLT